MRRILLTLLLPSVAQAQAEIGLRLGAGSFRENRSSVYRYTVPMVGADWQVMGATRTRERVFGVGLEWGQQHRAGRAFDAMLGMGATVRAVYAIGGSRVGSRGLLVGWQTHLAVRSIYGGSLSFSGNSDAPLGGYAALELAPVVAYRMPIRVAGRSFEVTDHLAIPLLTGAAAGVRGDVDYAAGVYLPGTFGGLTNSLRIAPRSDSRWRIDYQWSYRSVHPTFVSQQHASNSLGVRYELHRHAQQRPATGGA